MSTDPVRAGIEAEAKRIERETGCSALAHRIAANTWRWIYFVIGVPTAALAAVAGASALAHYRVAAAVLALGAAVASGLMTFMNPAAQAADHRRASSRHRSIENRARVFWEVTCATEKPTENLRHELSELVDEWNKANEESPYVVEMLYRRARRRTEESG